MSEHELGDSLIFEDQDLQANWKEKYEALANREAHDAFQAAQLDNQVFDLDKGLPQAECKHLLLWLRTETMERDGTSDGAEIRKWKDTCKKRRPRDATQMELEHRPVLRKNNLNGLPTVAFNGSQWFDFSSTDLPDAFRLRNSQDLWPAKDFTFVCVARLNAVCSQSPWPLFTITHNAPGMQPSADGSGVEAVPELDLFSLCVDYVSADHGEMRFAWTIKMPAFDSERGQSVACYTSQSALGAGDTPEEARMIVVRLCRDRVELIVDGMEGQPDAALRRDADMAKTFSDAELNARRESSILSSANPMGSSVYFGRSQHSHTNFEGDSAEAMLYSKWLSDDECRILGRYFVRKYSIAFDWKSEEQIALQKLQQSEAKRAAAKQLFAAVSAAADKSRSAKALRAQVESMSSRTTMAANVAGKMLSRTRQITNYEGIVGHVRALHKAEAVVRSLNRLIELCEVESQRREALGLGVLRALSHMLDSSKELLRNLSCRLVYVVVKNDANAQMQCLCVGVTVKLLELMDCNASAIVAKSAGLALASSLQHCVSACDSISSASQFQNVFDCLECKFPAVQVAACRVIAAISQWQNAAPKILMSSGHSKLLDLMQNEDSAVHDEAMLALFHVAGHCQVLREKVLELVMSGHSSENSQSAVNCIIKHLSGTRDDSALAALKFLGILLQTSPAFRNTLARHPELGTACLVLVEHPRRIDVRQAAGVCLAYYTLNEKACESVWKRTMPESMIRSVDDGVREEGSGPPPENSLIGVFVTLMYASISNGDIPPDILCHACMTLANMARNKLFALLMTEYGIPSIVVQLLGGASYAATTEARAAVATFLANRRKKRRAASSEMDDNEDFEKSAKFTHTVHPWATALIANMASHARIGVQEELVRHGVLHALQDLILSASGQTRFCTNLALSYLAVLPGCHDLMCGRPSSLFPTVPPPERLLSNLVLASTHMDKFDFDHAPLVISLDRFFIVPKGQSQLAMESNEAASVAESSKTKLIETVSAPLQAGRVIASLCLDRSTHSVIFKAGGVPSLVKLVACAHPTLQELGCLALGVLAETCMEPEILLEMAELGAVDILQERVQSTHEDVSSEAFRAMSYLMNFS